MKRNQESKNLPLTILTFALPSLARKSFIAYSRIIDFSL